MRWLATFSWCAQGSQFRQICVRPVARASRPWGVYKLSHGRDGHATKIRLGMRLTRYVFLVRTNRSNSTGPRQVRFLRPERPTVNRPGRKAGIQLQTRMRAEGAIHGPGTTRAMFLFAARNCAAPSALDAVFPIFARPHGRAYS